MPARLSQPEKLPDHKHGTSFWFLFFYLLLPSPSLSPPPALCSVEMISTGIFSLLLCCLPGFPFLSPSVTTLFLYLQSEACPDEPLGQQSVNGRAMSHLLAFFPFHSKLWCLKLWCWYKKTGESARSPRAYSVALCWACSSNFLL